MLYSFPPRFITTLPTDPLKTKLGNLSIRAFKLSAPAFKLYKEDKEFTAEMLRENNLTYENLFVEIPVVIKNSSLTNVLLCELDAVQDNTSFFTLPTRLVIVYSTQGIHRCALYFTYQVSYCIQYTRYTQYTQGIQMQTILNVVEV